MRAIIRQGFSKLFRMNLVLLSFITVLFSVAERQNFDGNYGMFVLQMITEHYLIIYCMTPVFLLSIFKILEDAPPFILIRSKRFSRYFFSKWLAVALFTFVFVMIQQFIVFIVGIGLPLQNEFWQTNSSNELMNYFQDNFHSPGEAMFLSISFMLAGLTFIGITLLTLSHFFHRKAVAAIFLVAYGLMAMSIKIPLINELPFITMNRYIILHHNFSGQWNVWWTIGAMVVVTLGQVILIRYVWHKTLKSWQFVKPKGMFFYYARVIWSKKNVLIMLTVLAILCVWKGFTSEQESMQDYFIRFFYGHALGEFYLMTFLEQLIYMGLSFYLIGIFFQDWCNRHKIALYIRLKNKNRWGLAVLKNGVLLQIFYVMLTGLFLIVGSVIFDKSIGDSILLTTQQQGLIGILLVLKAMECMTLFFLFFILFVTTKNVTISFFILLSMFAVNLFDYPLLQYNIAGISSVARLSLINENEGLSIMTAGTVALIYVCMSYGIARISIKRFFKGG